MLNLMAKGYLGLGSNIGNSVETLQKACYQLNRHPYIEVIATSSIYLTSPIGYIDQPDFYNLVTEVKTSLSPEELLHTILQIEKKLHRTRDVRWGPRTIDIDILIYDNKVIQEAQLQIPHPRMMDRGFVLVPLYEIAGDIPLPGIEKSVGMLLNELPLGQGITKWGEVH